MAIRLKKKPAASAMFQIAPMIDVVFLLLIYFMVGTTLQKQEADISFTLPGVAETDEPVDFPDEQVIEIRADGQVVVNDTTYDTPATERLIQLAGMLTRFRQASEASKSTVAVTIAPDPTTPHQRIVRVMDACAAAGITQVNFALGDEDE